METRQSLSVGRRFFILLSNMVRSRDCSMFNMTSDMPNKPMTRGTRPTPSESSTMSKVKRPLAEISSIPMQLKKSPKEAMSKDFHMGPLARKVRIVNPMTTREKYSGGPNCNAIAANGGATNIRPIMPSVPAMKDPKAEIPKAAPALPLRAIWYPSRQVTTEADSPGILTRMEVVDPPYMAP